MREKLDPGRIVLGRIYIPDSQAVEAVKANWLRVQYPTGLTLQNTGQNNFIPSAVRLVESKVARL